MYMDMRGYVVSAGSCLVNLVRFMYLGFPQSALLFICFPLVCSNRLLSGTLLSPEYTSTGQQETTCPGAIGDATAAGTIGTQYTSILIYFILN
tara:strand:+ start:523 stop:801 length:279 start_codon:yes stop_codon:yes gene_type:complete